MLCFVQEVKNGQPNGIMDMVVYHPDHGYKSTIFGRERDARLWAKCYSLNNFPRTYHVNRQDASEVVTLATYRDGQVVTQ